MDSGSADIFRGNFRLPFVGAGIVNVGTTPIQPPLTSSAGRDSSNTLVHESCRVKLNKPVGETWGAPPPDPPSSSRRNSNSQDRVTVRNRGENTKADVAR